MKQFFVITLSLAVFVVAGSVYAQTVYDGRFYELEKDSTTTSAGKTETKNTDGSEANYYKSSVSGSTSSRPSFPTEGSEEEENEENDNSPSKRAITQSKSSESQYDYVLGVAQVPGTSVQPNTSATRILIEKTGRTEKVERVEKVERAERAEEARKESPSSTPEKATTSSGTDISPEVSEEVQERIQDVGTSLRQLQREVRRVETEVRTTVSREVENAISEASRESLLRAESKSMRSFDLKERENRIEKLEREVAEKQDKLSEDVHTTITSGDIEAGHLDPVLKSSLAEIELLIEEETGVPVDLSPSARAITSVVVENTEQFNAVRKDLLSRDGLELYGDYDQDGVSNYDEKYIYKTDPQNAFTAGSSLTDGERILLGLDLFATTTGRVPVESPQVEGNVVEDVFEVHSINVSPRSATAGVSQELVTFSGRALPNSFVTLYIFSTPVVVTVKVDVSGAWTYTLDSELEDGTHELHVAMVDAGGKILAKSPVVPFVKRAEAAEFTPLLIPATADAAPLDNLQINLFLVGGLVFLVFVVGALFMLGKKSSNTIDSSVSQ